MTDSSVNYEITEVSVEVRFSVNPVDLEKLVDSVEDMCADNAWDFDWLEGEVLPYAGVTAPTIKQLTGE